MRLTNSQRELCIEGYMAALFSLVAFAMAWYFGRYADPNTMFGWVCGAMAGIVRFLGFCCLLASVFFMGLLILSKMLATFSAPGPTRRPPPPSPQ
jgi:hypothetical protein